MREEADYEVEVTGLAGVYTDARRVTVYGDGEVRRQSNMCFRARVLGGELSVSDESHEADWFGPEEVAELRTHHTQLLCVEHVATFEPMIGTLRSSHHVFAGRDAGLGRIRRGRLRAGAEIGGILVVLLHLLAA